MDPKTSAPAIARPAIRVASLTHAPRTAAFLRWFADAVGTAGMIIFWYLVMVVVWSTVSC